MLLLLLLPLPLQHLTDWREVEEEGDEEEGEGRICPCFL
jgi:hypothetical protein